MISTTRFINTAILAIGCFIFIGQCTANAQSIKVAGATSQGWAGGISDRYGQIYTIHLKIEQVKSPLLLDTLWVNGYCIGLQKYNKAKFKKGEKLDINIIENLIFNDGIVSDEKICRDPNKSGVVFSYHINKKKKCVDITDQIKELEFLGYP